MGYNVKVIKYDSEIQVNFYEHGVMVTDKHFMTDAEKKELKEKMLKLILRIMNNFLGCLRSLLKIVQNLTRLGR